MSLQNIETIAEENINIPTYMAIDPLVSQITSTLDNLQGEEFIELIYPELIVSQESYISKVNDYINSNSPKEIESNADSVIFTLHDNSKFAIGKRSDIKQGYIWHISCRDEDTAIIIADLCRTHHKLKSFEHLRTHNFLETIRGDILYGIDIKRIINGEDDYNTKKFPLTENDPQDPKLALKQFVETGALLLNINNFIIKHNDNVIYNQTVTQGIEKRARFLAPLELIFYGPENHTGIDMYLSILNARLKYPFSLERMDVVSYADRNQELVNNLCNKLIPPGFGLKKTPDKKQILTLNTPSGTPLIMRNEPPAGRYGKGQIKWTLQIPNQYLESVKQTILHTSKPLRMEENEDGFTMMDISQKGTHYLLEANGI